MYPLLEDDSCWLLACDLDVQAWQIDALALLEPCAERQVPAALGLLAVTATRRDTAGASLAHATRCDVPRNLLSASLTRHCS
jgi:hypothetical protein